MHACILSHASIPEREREREREREITRIQYPNAYFTEVLLV